MQLHWLLFIISDNSIIEAPCFMCIHNSSLRTVNAIRLICVRTARLSFKQMYFWANYLPAKLGFRGTKFLSLEVYCFTLRRILVSIAYLQKYDCHVTMATTVVFNRRIFHAEAMLWELLRRERGCCMHVFI